MELIGLGLAALSGVASIIFIFCLLSVRRSHKRIADSLEKYLESK